MKIGRIEGRRDACLLCLNTVGQLLCSQARHRDKLSPVSFPSVLVPTTRDVVVRDLDFQPMKTFSLNATQADSFLGVTDRHFIWLPVLGAARLWSRATSVCVLRDLMVVIVRASGLEDTFGYNSP